MYPEQFTVIGVATGVGMVWLILRRVLDEWFV